MGSLRDALILVAAGLLLSFIFMRPVIRAWRGRSWPHAKGTVTGSRVESGSSAPSTGGQRSLLHVTQRYLVHVSYRYEAGGSSHAGQRVSFFYEAIPHRQQGAATDDGRRYAKGTPVDVRYDPRDPASAVIDTSIPWHHGAVAAFSVIFLVLGLIGLTRILLH